MVNRCKRRTQVEELIPFSKKAQELVQMEKRKANEHKEFLEILLAVDIAGSFGTKLDTVIRHILHLKSEDPQIKILVFSQWEQVLEILKGGLEENEISTIKIDNSEKNRGQAAVQFLEDPDLTVFMLNARSQSAGLTLVSATHVFIIEPVTSGLDKQGT
jgi:SNF2 family DNA or RNA helicase